MSTTSTIISETHVRGAPPSPGKARDLAAIESFLGSAAEPTATEMKPSPMVADWEGQRAEPVGSALAPVPPPFHAKVFAISTPPPPRLSFDPNDDDHDDDYDDDQRTAEKGVQTSAYGRGLRCPHCGAGLSTSERSQAAISGSEKIPGRRRDGANDDASISASSSSGEAGVDKQPPTRGYRDMSAASAQRASLFITAMLTAAGVSPASSSTDTAALWGSSDGEGDSECCAARSHASSEAICIVLPERVPRSKRSKPAQAGGGRSPQVVLPERRTRRRARPSRPEAASVGSTSWLSAGFSSALQRLLDASGTMRLGRSNSKPPRRKASVRMPT
ncbi:hypothetical protein FOZ60_006472 [Perkinsus olseni]|uniref:Uncharacterized protein n=1 Tax=Perkinsus olseni TaxID=32597 RepID=A0A7J6RV19_PEROL|nr:hypothetical protein FOZ60_006472 [Perkinsus olseni]KAF4724618.1 hypothetical protein FOZ62_030272 [Perkinsus olseni]